MKFSLLTRIYNNWETGEEDEWNKNKGEKKKCPAGKLGIISQSWK